MSGLFFMKAKKLYYTFFSVLFVGMVWLLLHHYQIIDIGCFFKKITGLPCPSCGTTRSVLALLNGEFSKAFYWNPFGFLILAILLVVPFWIIYDVFRKKETFYLFYIKAEKYIQKSDFLFFIVMLVVLNWYWNFKKNF
jgi:hypothetical protein